MRSACFAAAVLVGVLVPGQAPASAVGVVEHECVEVNEFTFSPPLDLSSHGGSGTINWTRTCLRKTVTTSPLGESAYVVEESGSVGFTYFGSCALAILSGGTANVLIGGTVFVTATATAAPYAEARVQVLVPDSPCNMSRATVVGPKIELGTTP